MKLEPFVRAGELAFTLSAAEIRRRWGPPLRECRNQVALNELDYGHVVLRFQDGGRLEEITTQAPVLEMGALAVPFASLQGFVQAQDPEAFERARFIVSPRFGLAFDAHEPCWVTFLAVHCLDAWRAL
jgi:hypothetical protein